MFFIVEHVLVVSLQFLQIKCDDLLNTKLVHLSHISDFKCKFIVLLCHNFVRGKSFFKHKLLFAGGIKAQETCWE